jgi:hypothetical protein
VVARAGREDEIVNIISSYRPFDGCSPEIWENQITANRSWMNAVGSEKTPKNQFSSDKAFENPVGTSERIFYFNERDQRMSSAKTVFLPFRSKPPIKTMARFAAGLGGWTALINADIILTLNFRRVELELNNKLAACAVSRRFTLVRTTGPIIADYSNARITDNGVDFFAATPKVWEKVAADMPPEFLLGKTAWDRYLVNFFMLHFGNYCYDLTDSKICLHPLHEDRADQTWDCPHNNEIMRKNQWPFHSLTIQKEVWSQT